MPIVPLRELFTGPQTGAGPIGAGTSDAAGSQAGPLGWNLARRKPRSIWRSGASGPGAGTPTAGSASMIVRARPSVRPRAGRAILSAAFPPAGTAYPPLRGLTVGIRRRPTAGRAGMPYVSARPPQPPPLPSVRPVAAGSRWRAGRSAFAGLPRGVASTPPLAHVAAARPSRRGSTGFASPFRFPAGIARPSVVPPRATLTPIARLGKAPRRAGRAGPSAYPCRVPPSLVFAGARVVNRRGDDVARRRPGWLCLARTMGVAFSGQLHYNIYANRGAGDALGYSSPIGAVMATTWTAPILAAPGAWRFGVRAADVNGEEQNLDCAVTIVLDASGNDITDRPAPPAGLRAFPLAGGKVRVEWSYPPARGADAPTGFHVYLGAGASPDYSTPAAEVAYGSGAFDAFVADLPGLTDGMGYSIGVRAFNASGEEANTTTVGVTADATGPRPVDLLIATAIV